MSIRIKTLLIVGLPIVLLLVLIIGASQRLFLQGFAQIEQEETQQNLQRVSDALDNTVDQLSIKLSDWSSWDDTYKFIKDKNKAYVSSNLTDKALESLQVDMMVFLNDKGEIVFSKAVAHTPLHEIIVPQSFLSLLQPDSLILHHVSVDSVHQGIIMLPEGPLLIASRPILTSNNEGPIRGTVLFGRFLDATLYMHLEDITHLSLEFSSLDRAFNTSESSMVKEAFSKGTSVNPLSPTRIVGYSVMNDIFGKPALAIRVELPRTIYEQSQQTLQSFIRVLGFVTAVFALSTILLLEGVVLRRLGKLTHQVSQISTEGETEQKIILSGTDEFTELANTINTMAANLHAAYTTVEKKVQERTEELRKAQARLESSIDSLRIGFIMTDNNNEIVSINGSAKLLLTNKDLMTNRAPSTKSLMKNWQFKDVAERLHDTFDLEKELHTCLSEMKPIDVPDIPFGERYLHIFISPVILFRENGIGVLGTAILLEDVTEAKIIQKSKEEFFSIASHELRTPLTAIRGNTSLIKDYYADKITDDEVKGIIADIHDSSVHLIGIVNEFLNMSRLEQGRMTFKIAPVDLNQIITDSINQLDELAKEKNIMLSYVASSKHTTVKADGEKLKESILNLIGNAIKFTDKGGVTITTEVEKNRAKVIVSDTGKGIDKEDQELLFRKFEQARKEVLTKDTTQGSGLGLYITKLMIEGMKGDVYLKESTLGKGAVFVIELPVA